MSSKTYVYMIRCKGFLKIGHAKNPEKRIQELQIGNPFELTTVALLPFPSKASAHAFEKDLHRRLKKHKIRGEWFRYGSVALALKSHDQWDQKPEPKDEIAIIETCPF